MPSLPDEATEESTMEPLWQFVEKQLNENNFFSGGLILMAAGAVAAYCRTLPAYLWNWLVARMVIEVDILDRDPAFDWLDQWLSEHSYAQKRARSLSVRTRATDYAARQADPTGDHRPRILFSPAPGTHWLFYRNRLVVLQRERPKLNQAAQQPVNVRESFNLTFYSRNRNLVRQLLEEARNLAIPPDSCRLTVYANSYTSWDEQLQRMPRPAESVVLKQGVMESLLADARRFLEHRQWYVDRGIPYRRGYLLYGPPGTGKSSAVVAIASALKLDIAYLNLGSSTLGDSDLAELLSNLPASAILLVEDIDCVFVERKAGEDKANRVSFSGLLNALDGVAASEGRLLFATTNHRERLDPALIRPGRIDRQVEIGYADRDQTYRLFRRFFPESTADQAEQFAGGVPEHRLAISALQTYLIQHAESADDACRHLAAWLEVEDDAAGRGNDKAGAVTSTVPASVAVVPLPTTPFCVGL
jgi:chaperone BCS1